MDFAAEMRSSQDRALRTVMDRALPQNNIASNFCDIGGLCPRKVGYEKEIPISDG
jgi:hypothetical protein